MNSPLRALLFLALTVLPSCAFHSTATDWNTRVGPDGVPVHYTSTSKVGFKLLVLIPFLGDTEITGMVDDLSQNIADIGGDRVRIVQGSSENYWYGFPPFTWIITPVVSTLTAEYQPTPEELAKAKEEHGN